MYTERLKLKVKGLSREDLERLAVDAIFHLRCVAHSRNSFSSATHDALHQSGLLLQREPSVESMHQRAAMFLNREDA